MGRVTDETSQDRAADGSPPSARAVSEVIAVVLLLVLVALGTTVVVAFGSSSLQHSEQSIGIAQAEQAFTQLDSATSRVALGDATTQRVALGVGGSRGRLTARADSGRLTVTHVDIVNGTQTEVTNRSLGAVVYEDGQTAIAYQGGGVWRQDGDSSVPVSRPEFHYTDKTLTLPIILLRSTEHVHSDVTVTDGGPTLRSFPNASAGLENKVTDARIVVGVQSDYYDAWGRYFERETDGIVRYDHPNETVSVTFLALPEVINPRSGVIATSGPGDLELAGTGAYVDSYNSSQGVYAVSQSADGTVEAAGDVRITGNADISADVRSGDSVRIQSGAGSINGNVSWTTSYHNGGTVTGTTRQINGVPAIEPIDGYVSQQVETIRANNDNNRTSLITNDELTSSGELGPGRYYVDNLDIDGKTLVVNATTGTVTIAVQDWMAVRRQGPSDGNLTVKGDGRVQIIVRGADERSVSATGLGSADADVFVGKSSRVHVPGQTSRQLQILGPKDTVAIVSGPGATFDGIIYAPAGPTGSGYTYLKQSNLYGAVITGELTLGQYGNVHFDRSLEDEPLPLSTEVSRLEYLHVATHRVNVTSR
jgi:hypothetical protein